MTDEAVNLETAHGQNVPLSGGLGNKSSEETIHICGVCRGVGCIGVPGSVCWWCKGVGRLINFMPNAKLTSLPDGAGERGGNYER